MKIIKIINFYVKKTCVVLFRTLFGLFGMCWGVGGLRCGIVGGFGVFGRLILGLGGLVLGLGVMGLWGVIFVFGTGQGGFTGC